MKIQSALISVYHKDGLEPIIRSLNTLGVKIFSTGGTKDFIEKLGIKVTAVEDLTAFPEILGGRVKTLHPKIFGGILARRENPGDLQQMSTHGIPSIDLVIVDLYPFRETLASGASDQDIIEKIDIGGISLIRAAAKNHQDVVIIPSKNEYGIMQRILDVQQGVPTLEDRKRLAASAFRVSSEYDAAIFQYFNGSQDATSGPSVVLRYGENPHQQGVFHGRLEDVFEQISGKELSYNNLLDLDAAFNLIREFSEPVFAVIKHNNPCGMAAAADLADAWKWALSADPLSAFGGVLICNREVDLKTAAEINKIFFEVLAAPSFHKDALDMLRQKKNRILLRTKEYSSPDKISRTILNGILIQDRDAVKASAETAKAVTARIPSANEMTDLLFAEIVVKHAKSNSIVLAKDHRLLGIGSGLTSRVDALKHAIAKAKEAGLDLHGAVMASDAFFPFPDCVEIAHREGITAVIQPGGSVKDGESIAYCDRNNIAMLVTGLRHFKH